MATAKEETSLIAEAACDAAERLRYFDGRVFNGFGELADPSLAWGILREAQQKIAEALEAHNRAEKAGWTRHDDDF